ncbi:uncharacterized protein EI90DRAFT_3016674 [Cantharellus anzutake]|uniref:uncharacterized protein n=1 Tax=Cantharellus anzutake TaxID=1750568 RepID=UPI001903F65F|nr:uncharacterized protein EI90DRAFT_3016674 [Cantharellus anzutake]KAF8330854.1 hypothetical protein EI90DRAFT_3016674 [Cantharellus anzutake]
MNDSMSRVDGIKCPAGTADSRGYGNSYFGSIGNVSLFQNAKARLKTRLTQSPIVQTAVENKSARLEEGRKRTSSSFPKFVASFRKTWFPTPRPIISTPITVRKVPVDDPGSSLNVLQSHKGACSASFRDHPFTITQDHASGHSQLGAKPAQVAKNLTHPEKASNHSKRYFSPTLMPLEEASSFQ